MKSDTVSHVGTCFHCPAPATGVLHATLSSGYPQDAWIDRLVAAESGEQPSRGEIRVTAGACNEHRMALQEAIEDVTDCTPWGYDWGRSTPNGGTYEVPESVFTSDAYLHAKHALTFPLANRI